MTRDEAERWVTSQGGSISFNRHKTGDDDEAVVQVPRRAAVRIMFKSGDASDEAAAIVTAVRELRR